MYRRHCSALSVVAAKRWSLPSALALAMIGIAGSPGVARAQSGPWPPALGAYFWRGSEDSSGNGSTGDWAHAWIGGRWQGHAGSPPIIEWLPAHDGDSLFLYDTFIEQDAAEHHSITLTGLSFPASTMDIRVHGDYSGGHLEFASVGIGTVSNKFGSSHPLNFTGTSIVTDSLGIEARSQTITFNEVDFTGVETVLNAGYYPTSAEPAPLIRFNEATFNASLLKVVQHPTSFGETTVEFKDSTLTGLGYELGFGATNDLALAAAMKLDNSDATIAQFLLIGSEGAARLRLENSSTLAASAAYVNVGQAGPGDLYVTTDSILEANSLNVGVVKEGNVAIDHNAQVTTQTGVVGALGEAQGTVNIESGGEWRVHDLTVGQNGTGYIYVRDNGTLRVDGQGVFGKLAGSRGVLNLIGTSAHLQTTQQFIIGDRGAGEVNLSKGATYASQGQTTLGDFPGSSGTVTIDGEEGASKWTVTGKLIIGHRSTGRVEVTKGGALKAEGSEIVLGEEAGSNGTLLIGGQGTQIESSGAFLVGDAGTGTMRVDNGAQYTAKEITVADENNSTGTLELVGATGSSQTMLTVTENLTIGRNGLGTLTVDGGSTLETKGEAAVAAVANKSATATVSGGSHWIVPQGGTLRVGRDGHGTLNIEGGSEILINGTVNLADNGGSSQGDVSVKGSSLKLQAGSLVVGKAGTGNLTFDTGSITSSQAAASMIVGSQANSHGTLAIKGTARFNSRGELFVGKSSGSTGTVVLETGGILDLHLAASPGDEHGFILGYDQGATGTLDIRSTATDGSLVTPGGFMVIGRSGKGTMTVRGGAINNQSTNYALGVMGTGDGTLDISGDAISLGGHDFLVGGQGKGSLKVQNKSHLNVHQLDVGTQGAVLVSGDARVQVASGDVVVRNEMTVQSGGSVELAGGDFLSSHLGSRLVTGQSAETQTPSKITARNFRVGAGGNPASLAVEAGGLIEADDEISVQAQDSGLIVTGAGSQASRAIADRFIISADGVASGITIANGGILETRSSTAGLVQVGPHGLLGVASGFAKIHGLLQSSGEVIMLGGGRIAADRVLIPSGGKIDLTGGTMVVGGNLDDYPALPNNTLLVRANGRMQVNVVTALISNPTIEGKIINGGTFIVGQSPGNLVLDGSFEMQPTGILEMEIGGLTPGVQFDQILATGAITLGGTLDIDLVTAGGLYLPTVGAEFTMFNAQGGVAGAFANAARLNSVAAGWRVDWSLASTPGAAKIKAESVRLQADFDGSGVVNSADLTLWRGSAGLATNALHSQGDADGDLDVDGADFLVWQRQLGLSAMAVAASAAVPEPNAASLAAATTLVLLVLTRRRRELGITCM